MDQQAINFQVKKDCCDLHGSFESKAFVAFGKVFPWSKCPVCVENKTKKEADEKRIKDEIDRQKRIEKRLDMAGIPYRFRSKKFENFLAKTKKQIAAFSDAKEFAENFQNKHETGATLVFSGMPGTGKSHLAISICHAIMDGGYTAMYLNALDAVRAIRSTWKRDADKSEKEVMSALTGVDLLVIDEVGAQYGTDGEQVILFDIINRRYQDQMPMVLLTNQGVEGFKQYLGDRSFDRLREAGKWVTFDWESYRGQRGMD